jgi:uncharacterized protein (DUF58 family)
MFGFSGSNQGQFWIFMMLTMMLLLKLLLLLLLMLFLVLILAQLFQALRRSSHLQIHWLLEANSIQANLDLHNQKRSEVLTRNTAPKMCSGKKNTLTNVVTVAQS